MKFNIKYIIVALILICVSLVSYNAMAACDTPPTYDTEMCWNQSSAELGPMVFCMSWDEATQCVELWYGFDQDNLTYCNATSDCR
jgi:hypothetical protein